MLRSLFEGLAFALLVLSTLSFVLLMIEYPLIVLGSLAFVAPAAVGYEIARRKSRKP